MKFFEHRIWLVIYGSPPSYLGLFSSNSPNWQHNQKNGHLSDSFRFLLVLRVKQHATDKLSLNLCLYLIVLILESLNSSFGLKLLAKLNESVKYRCSRSYQ